MDYSNPTSEIKHVLHWSLIRQREPIASQDPNNDGFVEMQALRCPFYVPLEGSWGADWGAIVHPSSKKFGQLVFEHEWCGCTYHSEEREDT